MMELKKCQFGHQYDASLPECPECAALANRPMGATVPAGGSTIGNFGSFGNFGGGVGPTVPMQQETAPADPQNHWAQQQNYVAAGFRGDNQDYGATRPLETAPAGATVQRPVTGWLVCIDGPEKGKDYRIHADHNYIGRGSNMDICINDNTVSRVNHAILAHDPRSNIFYFAPAAGTTLVRHNGKVILSTVELAPKDKLEIGKGTFLFVPLCGDDFAW